MPRRGVFLDRDGVLVEAIVGADGNAYAPTRLEDFHLVADAAEQVRRLREAGLVCVVFTNQPEIARGLLEPQTLDEMHRILRDETGVDDILVCGHDEGDGCRCRKPKTGMLEDGAARWSLSLTESFVIGDRWRDVDAGLAAGCFSILLERDYSRSTRTIARVERLSDAIDIVLDRIRVT